MSISGRRRPEFLRSPAWSRMTIFSPPIGIMAICWPEGRNPGVSMPKSWAAGMDTTRARAARSTSRPPTWVSTTHRGLWPGSFHWLRVPATRPNGPDRRRPLWRRRSGRRSGAGGIRIASLWKLPVLFRCENNGKYGAVRAVGAAPTQHGARRDATRGGGIIHEKDTCDVRISWICAILWLCCPAQTSNLP